MTSLAFETAFDSILGRDLSLFTNDSAAKARAKERPNHFRNTGNVPPDVEYVRQNFLYIPQDLQVLAEVERLQSATHRQSGSSRAVPAKISPEFMCSEAFLHRFLTAYNGRGFKSVLRRLSGASIDATGARDLLAATLEDALIAITSSQEESLIVLDADEELTLISAIAERMPRIYEETAARLAEDLVEELKNGLTGGSSLIIENGMISLSEKSLCIRKLHQRNKAKELPPENREYALAA